ncbi:hypothetical protein RD792_006349 [Penstemon davidsonii]|uniref:Protein kinase domain-containing protein n=1 Tax=Penstemon davidsonii TaxID=160366 RepID=A0ABR0DDB9_9LAMI|nr:hypothetical protein RD792_006349 [Penstemon davidsonii]
MAGHRPSTAGASRSQATTARDNRTRPPRPGTSHPRPAAWCRRRRRVTAVNLFNMSLQGTIAREIGNLSFLTYLNIRNNSFSGAIPFEIGNLRRLRVLQMTFNRLTGHIPTSLGLLRNLEILDLADNDLTGSVPWSIFNISSLIEIVLTRNDLSGSFPSDICSGGLSKLQQLRVSSNQFVGDFPRGLSNCVEMRNVFMSRNKFSGSLPMDIGNLGQLQILALGGNQLSGTIPSEIGNLNSLLWLQLGDNNLTGMIPETLGRLRNMHRLSISRNKLHGPIPNSFCNLENMFQISLRENELSGQLPSCLGNLPSLQEIHLADNFFNSSIPSTLLSSSRLQIVSLARNLFEGSLSNEIGNMNSLRALYLSGNQLYGSIPSSIGELQSLTNLQLQNNMFNGSIPSSLGNMRALQYLDLSENNLSGSIPMSLETLTYLDYFNVSFNELTGQIPDGGPFGNFSSEFFIGNKGLCGASLFNVEVCKGNTPKSSRRNILLRFILPPMALVILAATTIITYLFKCRGRNSALLSFSEANIGLKHERISYYEIFRATDNLNMTNLIGKGSIGSVYKGTFSNEICYAVKVFELDVQGAFKSFDTECQIMRSLRHRNLVKVITSCSNLDFKALVLEYMPNGNLDKWLYSSNYSLNIAQRVGIMIDVSSAIEYLHQGYSSPIVHCDLKPSNILLDKDMVACVGDFGIAKILTHDQRMAQTKTLGTIGYMAPEYGSGGLVSTFADVYSYGILLMETFTKKRPTDELFLGELTMKRWVSESFPNSIMHIVDTELLNADEEYSVKYNIEECLTSIMELAIECTSDLPDERPNMKDVHVRLMKINNKVVN